MKPTSTVMSIEESRTTLEWMPSLHHDVPQPAGKLCAAWYEATQPSACEILYALAHTKGEADALRAALQAIADPAANMSRGAFARAALAKVPK